MGTDVVTCFCRHRGRILLNRRASGAPTYPSRWAAVSGLIEDGESPEAAARREIREETGFEDPTLVRSGRVQAVRDEAIDREWRVHPFLFDVPDGEREPSKEFAETEWVHPTAIRGRETVPELWETYRRVAPTVRSVAADDVHGSAYVSLRALEVIRDRAGLLATSETEADDGTTAADAAADDGWEELADLAGRLRSARPEMVVLKTRIDRAMAGGAARTPGAVLTATIAEIDRASSVDEAAAAVAADYVTGENVLTLSRSGTVLAALQGGDPNAAFVAESRPDREGIGVAEELAGTTTTVVHTDAAVADVLDRRAIDVVLVGADAVGPDGSVVNKTGTRTVAAAADYEDVPVYVAASTDKVATDRVRAEAAAGTDLYGGEDPIEVHNPLFDETPPELVSAMLTERGELPLEVIENVADRHRAMAAWRAAAGDECEKR